MPTPLDRHIKTLAFQLDRKILETPEADHIRMDLPPSGLIRFKRPKIQRPYVVRLIASTLALFTVFFMATNAPSYVQIFKASVTDVSRAPTFQSAPTLTSTPTAPQEIPPLKLTPLPIQNRIEIPSLGINAPVVEVENGVSALKGQDWNTLEESIHKSLSEGVVHYPGTAEPGKRGNVFLTGHSSNVFWELSDFNTVFAKLPKIKIGDEILIAHDQNLYRYKITETKEVQPNDVSVLTQGDGYEITLMTCTPVGTRLRRFIAKGTLIAD